jgi:hypothetical protein
MPPPAPRIPRARSMQQLVNMDDPFVRKHIAHLLRQQDRAPAPYVPPPRPAHIPFLPRSHQFCGVSCEECATNPDSPVFGIANAHAAPYDPAFFPLSEVVDDTDWPSHLQTEVSDLYEAQMQIYGFYKWSVEECGNLLQYCKQEGYQ